MATDTRQNATKVAATLRDPDSSPLVIDSSIDVKTPENTAVSYLIAGPWRRGPAFLIDMLVRIVVFAGILFLAGLALGVSQGLAAGPSVAMITLSWFAMEWFYGGIFETFWNGQTPGKRAMGLRVLTTAGEPINGMQAIQRNIFRYADMMPILPVLALITALNIDLDLESPSPALVLVMMISPLPTYMLGIIMPMLNPRNQRIGDLVADTLVVVEEKSWLKGLITIPDKRVAQLAALIPANFQVSRSLSRTLSMYADRRRGFSPERRHEIASHLGRPLLERFNLPADTDYDLLLCALYYRVFVTDRAPMDEEPSATSDVSISPSPFSPGGRSF